MCVCVYNLIKMFSNGYFCILCDNQQQSKKQKLLTKQAYLSCSICLDAEYLMKILRKSMIGCLLQNNSGTTIMAESRAKQLFFKG